MSNHHAGNERALHNLVREHEHARELRRVAPALKRDMPLIKALAREMSISPIFIYAELNHGKRVTFYVCERNCRYVAKLNESGDLKPGTVSEDFED